MKKDIIDGFKKAYEIKLKETLQPEAKYILNDGSKEYVLYTDHILNIFPSINEMCKYHNMDKATFIKRRLDGFTVKEALTMPKRKYNAKNNKKYHRGQECTDHLGQRYRSKSEMCRAHGVSPSVYENRRKAGRTVEEALTGKFKMNRTTPCHKKEIADFKGKRFASIKEMCEAYGIKYTSYMERIKRGWALEEALTTPIRKDFGY